MCIHFINALVELRRVRPMQNCKIYSFAKPVNAHKAYSFLLLSNFATEGNPWQSLTCAFTNSSGLRNVQLKYSCTGPGRTYWTSIVVP